MAVKIISRVNLNAIVHIILNYSRLNANILTVAHILNADYMCISITLRHWANKGVDNANKCSVDAGGAHSCALCKGKVQ